MITAASLAEMRNAVSAWRRAGSTVAFVPTMGNLHAGHMALLELAKQRADRVVASIFVNPMQFGAGEDFDAYPRTLEEDQAKLTAAGTDLLLCPKISDIFPHGCEHHTAVEVSGLSNELCGQFRPGHFRGVATIVCKLLNWVQPDILILGEKDYQQLVIVQRMVADLDIPVTVVGGATVREPSGLALSSRNSYLTVEQRAHAPELYRCLTDAAALIGEGRSELSQIETRSAERLMRAGFRVDYVSIRRASDLSRPTDTDRALVALAAAWLGHTRLIDNQKVTRPPVRPPQQLIS